ncbi:MAG: 1-deoxy-D-xylulose-5-phosphate reductoisomerase [Thermoleophilia bacterium]|nr:1-deoxy-D-xylulose-5-phosphate reductoisomerase [Thermoleophilia bacterium]
MKRVLVLGSTGSIGVQALDVIDAAEDLVACGLSCAVRHDAMAAQAADRGIVHTSCAAGGGTVPYAPDLAPLIEASQPDLVLNAIVGAVGLQPTLAALERGLPVALANKESLVVGGDLVAAARKRSGAALIPVDSEHSALFQLLMGVSEDQVAAGVLTASGGPFRGRSAAQIADATPDQALAHPTWSMGAKITIDSATMMNKGLEIIEAHHLFGLPYDRIEVVVHPQSVIHAMVRLVDGSLLTHAGPPDMRIPIGYALRHPQAPPEGPRFDLVGRELTFHVPDAEAFPCLAIARAAGEAGGTAPTIMNAANEVAVQAFLDNRLPFGDIPRVVAATLGAVHAGPARDLDTVLEADARGREAAKGSLAGLAEAGR